ncbi:unnamed protein product [Thelazia callipaeda]|uniref:Uncharacterized protein n=1 Tax=Thelazia callipaeda TaxID=103827 RepID=A0A0N5CJJ8_THECL|nr:unnamed protein product [Thelazia callipaeda]
MLGKTVPAKDELERGLHNVEQKNELMLLQLHNVLVDTAPTDIYSRRPPEQNGFASARMLSDHTSCEVPSGCIVGPPHCVFYYSHDVTFFRTALLDSPPAKWSTVFTRSAQYWHTPFSPPNIFLSCR